MPVYRNFARVNWLAVFSLCLSFSFIVSCTKQPPSTAPDRAKDIISFVLAHADHSAFDTTDIAIGIAGDSVIVTVPQGTNLVGLIPDIQISGISISPATGVPQDFSQPVTYTVTAADGTSKTYTIICHFLPASTTLFVGSSNNNFYAINAVNGTLRWQYHGTGSFSYASPTVYNGLVYGGSTDNTVYAFDMKTGTVQWQFSTGGSIEASLSVHDGVMYVGSDDHNMYALDAMTGTLKWKYTTGANVSSSTAVKDGVAYFGSSDNNVYALNVTDGSVKWIFSAGAMINQSGATISNGVVFIGSRDGYLYAIDAVSGQLKWKYAADGMSLEQSSPTVSNGLVYIGGWYDVPAFSTGGSVYAVNENTGALVWKALDNLGFSSSPYVSGGVLYISADDGNFYALDALTGTTRWNKLIYPNGAGATVANGIVFIGGGGTWNIYAYDAASGTELWKFPVPGGIDNSSPCIAGSNGVIYHPGASGEQF